MQKEEESQRRSVFDWTSADARAHVLSAHIPWSEPATCDGVKGTVTLTMDSLTFSGGGVVKGCDLSAVRVLDIVDGNTLAVGYSAGGETRSFKLGFEPRQGLGPQLQGWYGSAYRLVAFILDVKPDVVVPGKRIVSGEEYEGRMKKARELIRSWKKPEEHLYDKAFDEYADVMVGVDVVGARSQDILRAILTYEGDKRAGEFEYIYPPHKEDAVRDAKKSRDYLINCKIPLPDDS
jgi:hypothetical protein